MNHPLYIISAVLLFIFLIYILYIGLWPRKKFKKFTLDEDEHLPPSKSVRIGKFHIHYLQEGKGPDLVLLHGLGASVYVWRYLFKSLSQHYRVTALDLPGFGQSSLLTEVDYGLDAQTERIHLFLKKLKIHKAFFVGSSMGGTLALWYAKKHPESCEKLALLSPATNPRIIPAPHFLIRMTQPLWPYLLPIGKPLIMRKVMDLSIVRKRHTKENCFQTYDNNPDAFTTLTHSLKGIADPRLPNELKSLSLPTLILWGTKDHIIPYEYIEELHQILNSSTLEEIPGGSHHPMEDQHQVVTKSLIQFFDT